MSTPASLRLAGLGLACLLAASGCSLADPATPGGSAGGSASASTAVAPAPTSGTSAPAGPTDTTPPGTSPTTTTTSPSTTTSTTKPGTLAVTRNSDGSCTMPATYAGKDFETLSTSSTRKVIALTFDGGASAAAAPKIVSTLAAKDAVATFFFTGQFAKANPALVKSIAARYPIGNHSFNHPDMTKLSQAQVTQQIGDAEAAITQAAGGVSPVPFFRFPLGARNATTIKLVNQACYVPFRWTVDSLGWVGTTGTATLGKQSVQIVTDRVLKGATPGGIVLMHVGDNPNDGSTLDSDALPAIIDGLRAKGYELVTLREALKA